MGSETNGASRALPPRCGAGPHRRRAGEGGGNRPVCLLSHGSQTCMQLNIETFSNVRGGNAFFKAVTHPLAAEKGHALIARLARVGRVAIYDPENCIDALAQIYDLAGLKLAGLYAQDVAAIGRTAIGQRAQPVTALKDC